MAIEKAVNFYQNTIHLYARLLKIRAVANLPQARLQKEDLPPVHIMHDHLRFLAESEAYRVLKLRAERGMGQALSMGFCVLAIVNLGYWMEEATLLLADRFLLEIFFLVAMWSFWQQSAKVENYYAHGVCTQWLLSLFPVNAGQVNPQLSEIEPGKGLSDG